MDKEQLMAPSQAGYPVAGLGMRAAWAGLKSEYRQVIVEMYHHGRSVAETAGALGIPPEAVIVRAYHGVHELRRSLPTAPVALPLPAPRAIPA